MIRDNTFIQRISDGYFNATKLLEEYNKLYNEGKQLGKYKITKSTMEFIELLKREGIENPMITGRGTGIKSGTWMHPKLFIDFAMWVSVEFKSKVIDYVLDGLIKMRHEAGDYYKEMCETIMDRYIEYYKSKPPAMIFIHEANMIRSLVTDKTDRNEMTETELKQITYLQKVNANLIKKGIGKESRIKRIIEANEISIT